MANEQINKIKKEYFVMDEYGYTDKELIDQEGVRGIYDIRKNY